MVPHEAKSGHRPAPAYRGNRAKKSAEESLDELLDLRRAVAEREEPPPLDPEAVTDPLDAIRWRLAEEMIPVFEEVKTKYQAYGISLSLDAGDFLMGGRRVVMEFTLPPRSIKLEGTVVNEGIAFNELHSVNGIAGAISSGPMLRTRLLTIERFRDFICAQLAPLVRTKLRQK